MIRGALESMAMDARNALATVDVGGDGRIVLPCGGVTHSATIAGGRFVLDDHDLESELSLLVFGAVIPSCLIYQETWTRAFDDDFLAAWSVDGEGDRARRDREDWYENYWESWPTEPSAARALFGSQLQAALAMEVAKQWVASRGSDGPGGMWALVRRAIAVRARRAFVLSLASVDAHRRPDALVPVRITVVPEGAPSMTGRLGHDGSRVELVLPVRWLWDVWAGGALVDGRFVLARDAGGSLLAVEWAPTGRAEREHVPRMLRMADRACSSQSQPTVVMQ